MGYRVRVHNSSIDPLFYAFLWEKGVTYSSLMTFIGSCLFVPSIYLSPELRRMVYTRGPWVTRRPSNQGSKKGHPSLWLRGKNLGQGLGFCNFLPGKLPHTGTFYISSARPPIVLFRFFGLWLDDGTNLGITSRLLTSVHPDPLNRSLVWDGDQAPCRRPPIQPFC